MLLITEPNLRCGHCWDLYVQSEGSFIPSCRTEKGCHIEDLATDAAVNEFCDAFIRARSIYEYNKVESVLIQAFEEMGIVDDLDFLLDLESIFAKWLNTSKQKKWNKIV